MSAADGTRGSRPVAGHVLRSYLPRTETFVYSALRAQHRWQPVVLARYLENLEEFPFPRVHPLVKPGDRPQRRLLRRARARLSGAPSTFDHRLARLAGAAGCRILHAHFGWAGLDALWAAGATALPLLTTFYGWDVGQARVDEEWRAQLSELFRAGSAFACEGPAMAGQMEAVGCPPQKLHVIRIGIELERFPFAPPQRRRPLVIMQAARMVPKKGFDLSIRALAATAGRGPAAQAELWLVGDGPLRGELEELAHHLGVAGRVRFLGSVSHARYRELLAQAHIGIQPSRTGPDGDTEGGAPTVLLELQARGVPVVATRHADIPHVVARLDQLADEEDVEGLARIVEELASLDEAEWQRRTGEGRALMEREHDVAATAAALQDLYDRLSTHG